MGVNAFRINLVFVTIFFTVFIGSTLIGSGFFRMQYDANESVRLIKAGGYFLLAADFVSRFCLLKKYKV